MQIVFVKKTNLNNGSSVTRLIGVMKRKKDAEKTLAKLAEKWAMTGQWELLRNTGKGVAGGFEYAYAVLDVTEGVTYDDKIVESLFG